jgi:hypothetical protein
MGRRIDLIISSLDIELCSSEWKRETVSKGLIATQQVKNARTSKAILKAIERLPLNERDRDDLFTIGMDCIGKILFYIL